jgi:cyclic beta-1,2-glucan synthetase
MADVPSDLVTSAPIWVSNGNYGALLTAAGTGFTLYKDHLLSSWQDDPCEDELGFTIFLRDLGCGSVWTACGPALPGDDPGVLSAQANAAVLERRRGAIGARVALEVLESAAIERRRLTLTNHGLAACEVEITGYLEVTLNYPAAHAAHPAFSKLFVQTHREGAALIATRRPRANGETHPAMALGLLNATVTGFETDRARFLGRGRRSTDAQALRAPLSGAVGNVLDPVLALRTVINLGPGETAEILFVTAAAGDPRELVGNLGSANALEGLAPARIIDAPAAALGPGIATLADAPLWRQLLGLRLSAPMPRDRAASSPVSEPERPVADIGAIDLATNGFGSFSPDGREYTIQIRRDSDGSLRLPPMPWSNLIANKRFGLIASEKGSLSTFAGNSRLYRITPWNNDPIVDPHDEAFYLRDAVSGESWSLLPGPAPAAQHFDVAHGYGYSRWRHEYDELRHSVLVFVPCSDPLRIAEICIRNDGPGSRKCSIYAYNRWVLGATPAESLGQLSVEIDSARRAILANNPKAGAFRDMVAFAALAGAEAAAFDAGIDRARFLGTPGTSRRPAAIATGGALSADAGVDPCACLRVEIIVEPGQEVRIAALLGAADSREELDQLLARYRMPGAIAKAFAAVQDFWTAHHSRMQIETPIPAIDLMVNGWLAYQITVCRLWARSAYYQSGGAFGFRDQLQDAAALVLTQPDVLRDQLQRSAMHQFTEGDVLHWWHPPEGVGIRTRFADDLVWLPYLTAHYVRVTGDRAALEEVLPFVAGLQLAPGEDERYFLPDRSDVAESLYGHCVKALERAMTSGVHGLPLFGGGDWNDGMNRVGHDGRGESVWMGFFLVQTLADFIPLCRERSESDRAARFEAYRTRLVSALNDAGWDGDWYRRGYYDNGHPLGSALSDECQIDALVQAWAVISKVATVERAAVALDSLEKRLISDEDRLIRLLTPPFESTAEDPGYIKGYVAGVRENGGQYTHAALWVVRALAEAGRRTRAAALLEMLSPVTHSADAESVARYQVEPYVIAADIYGVAPHVGRGGWTWYTGSAGWMLRVSVETILGFGIEAGKWLTLAPKIPDEWPGFKLSHRRPDGTRYEIRVENPQRVAQCVTSASMDGNPIEVGAEGLRIRLSDDERTHTVRVVLGACE